MSHRLTAQEQTDDDAETDAGDGVVEGVAHRLPEERVAEQVSVVAQPPDAQVREVRAGEAGRAAGQDVEADVQSEFERHVQFSLDLARSADDPDNPVSHLGNEAPDFQLDRFNVSFGAVQLTGAASVPTSIAMKRSFLCASIPTYVVICFTTGSYRCGSGAARR